MDTGSDADIELLKLFLDRADDLNTYWHFYILVATAVVGILASGKIRLTGTVRGVITFAFAVFAASNYSAIQSINQQRKHLANELASFSALVDAASPNSALAYLLFHLLLDASVIAAVWCFHSKADGN